MLVVLLIGFGKSLIYQISYGFVDFVQSGFDPVRQDSQDSAVLGLSPLSAVMNEQLNKFF